MKRLIIGLALVMLLLATVSCATGPSPEEGAIYPPAPEEGVSMPLVAFKGEGAGTYPLDTTEITQDRMIVRIGDMRLVVEDVINARDDIAQLALRYDGYVVSSSIWGEEEEMRGQISIRVPDEKFDQALAELRELAVRVKSESTSSQDVTQEYTDLQARLNNAEATEKQYLALLEKATDVQDILSIYESLSRVRQEIEQIKGQMQYLERTSSMSLINVYLEPQATAKPLVGAGWSALEALKSAIRGIVVFGQWLGIIAIWLIIFIPVWGTVLGIIYWRRKRKKTKGLKVTR
jgi:hypothetical protein